VFGREELIAQTLALPRRGALNFVVGVNGSGKSSLLRTLYQTFRALSQRQRPALSMTLCWDRTQGKTTLTTLLHVTNQPDAMSFCATIKQVPTSARRSDWEQLVSAIDQGTKHPFAEDLQIAHGDGVFSSSLLYAQLPKHVIAYSSGAIEPWTQLDHHVFHPEQEEEAHYISDDERPQGWSMDQEWEQEQPIRVSDLLTRQAMKVSGTKQVIPGAGEIGELTSETIERLRQELGPLDAIRQKLSSNRMQGNERLDDSILRIQSRHLRYAGITLGLWQAANELAGRTTYLQRAALRPILQNQDNTEISPGDARRLLNKIDWFQPTHLSLTYRDADDRVSPRQHQELLCLVALADEVIAQPRGRMRAVFSLGPADKISLSEQLEHVFPFGLPSKAIEFAAERVDGSKTMAEAILRVFSDDTDLDSSPMNVFARLRDWERTGLLEDLTLTIQRLHQPVAGDGELDDIVVTFDQLSDGEQMLLGRMGLLFLLRGQDGSLLLLDEPETHFNDVWKREIVEMIDMGLLNSTEANVIVATHTSIALTDAFAAEVTVLDKLDGHTTARGVTGGLFGTDPGEVNMNLFRAESSIGRSSLEILDQLLKTDWKGREDELKAVIDILGSSFHRAELRAILKNLRADPDGAASS
jgi:energy-coupling factor transporter ATP-binding protein EcfA2